MIGPPAATILRSGINGKRLYMAVPRLAEERCFVELTAPDILRRGISLEKVAGWRGTMQHGRLVSPEDMEPNEVIETHTKHPRPKGLDWEKIRAEQ